MMTDIIMHNMIVEIRREGYESELFMEAERAVEKGRLLDENGVEKEFIWNMDNNIEMSDMAWANHLNNRESQITDEEMHYSLKGDLVEHVWNRHGSL